MYFFFLLLIFKYADYRCTIVISKIYWHLSAVRMIGINLYRSRQIFNRITLRGPIYAKTFMGICTGSARIVGPPTGFNYSFSFNESLN